MIDPRTTGPLLLRGQAILTCMGSARDMFCVCFYTTRSVGYENNVPDMGKNLSIYDGAQVSLKIDHLRAMARIVAVRPARVRTRGRSMKPVFDVDLDRFRSID